MSALGFCFDSDQLDAAGRLFVEQGPAATRDLRQAEVAGAMNFRLSDAARKLRVQHAPASLAPDGTYPTRPERIGG